MLGDKRAALYHGDAADLASVLPIGCVDAVVTDPPAGIGFMGKDWDKNKGGRDQWIAWLRDVMGGVLKVMKPGGHVLVWALPRTSHWTATALEDAGFEVRDRVCHLFGSGFPKSLDVSKAIDERLGVDRPVVGKIAAPNRNNNLVTMGDGWKDAPDLTAPGSPEAALWEGWGTALKPAMEDWWLVRKPLDGTVAANVLKHGTGGLNIDGCRLEESPRVPGTRNSGSGATGSGSSLKGSSRDRQMEYAAQVASGEIGGRWPAHVTFDEEAAAMLGEQSRFFYVAKPSRKEKEAGLSHLAPRTAGEATDREDGTADGLKEAA